MASFLLYFVIMLQLMKSSSGLICQKGHASNFAENISQGTCEDAKDQYCMAISCMKGVTATMAWGCSVEEDKTACASEAKNLTETITKQTNISCECHFGQKGNDLTNVPFKLPPVPTVPSAPKNASKVLACKIGVFAENGYGFQRVDICRGDEEFCYALSCVKNGQISDLWGCYAEDNCEMLNQFWGSNCHFCRFGQKGVNLSNLELMVPTFLNPAAKVNVTRTPALTTIISSSPTTTVAEVLTTSDRIPAVTTIISSNPTTTVAEELTTSDTPTEIPTKITETIVDTTTASSITSTIWGQTTSALTLSFETEISTEMPETTTDENHTLRANVSIIVAVVFVLFAVAVGW